MQRKSFYGCFRTIILTAFVSLCVGSTSVARTILNYDFEDGQIPNGGPRNPNAIPATILTDPDGNHFLRMTASLQDCGPAFATTCPRTRAELIIGHAPETSGTVVYNFSLRMPSSNPSGQYNLLMQLFQGLGDPVNGGKTIWIGSQDGRFFLENDLTHTVVDMGAVTFDRWINFSLQVYLSTSSSGRADAYIDGSLGGTITGEPTQKISDVTDMFVDVIDFGGVSGIADFDNIQINNETVGAQPTMSTDGD